MLGVGRQLSITKGQVSIHFFFIFFLFWLVMETILRVLRLCLCVEKNSNCFIIMKTIATLFDGSLFQLFFELIGKQD